MTEPRTTSRGRRTFAPILAGATAHDRVRACVGVAIAIALVALQGSLLAGDDELALWIVAPMGASAVLVFAIPSSPMAQPWPTIGGNALSALVGVAVGSVVGHTALAAGLAVALALALMSVTRSLHPPGGAAALTGVLGGSAVASAGWLFPLVPVAMNALVLVAVAWVFHRLAGHPYPHTAPVGAPPLPAALEPSEEDLDAVLAELGETFDVSRDDLSLLLAKLEARVLARGDAAAAPGAQAATEPVGSAR